MLKTKNEKAERILGYFPSRISDEIRRIGRGRRGGLGDIREIRIRADGFLYNMVRIIVGTLVEVSEGKIREDEIGNIISSLDRKNAGRTAPPDGLYLNSVKMTI